MTPVRLAVAAATVVASATLVLPAVAAAAPTPAKPSSPVIRDCLGKPTVKPTRIVLACADAGSALTRIVWHEWNANDAIGSATLEENDCTPNCASGRTVKRAVGINAHTPVGTGADRRFTVITYGASGSWGNSFQDAQLP
ncbi:hypothetical protein [Tsukamurella pseudospumae]|uniref:Secreted protein n=1 Tax=Tsukamurella pseudospumae TaxID=239498 RepID=A0A138A7U0_9ACTN|nr:hypothetical protein [Tsukamurella pseudospumae]KXP06506.1 hypothetical protein AXK60_10500 [Tsukamurella pseudospumae]